MKRRVLHPVLTKTPSRGLERIPLKRLAAAMLGALGLGVAGPVVAASHVPGKIALAQAGVHKLQQVKAAQAPAAGTPGAGAASVLSMQAMSVGPTNSLITQSGTHALDRPQTIQHKTGSNVWTITSNTTVDSSHGRVSLNSFGDFDVAAGDTVNLDMAKGVSNLVNLVWGESAQTAMQIYGTVNSYANGQTGKISGNVFFADPYGVVVGAGGVLNVGSLSASATTDEFMDKLLDYANGGVSKGDLDTFLVGQEPTEAGAGSACADTTAMICVAGAVNATNAVRLHATTIDVSGEIDVAGSGLDSLATAVNLEGVDEPEIVHDGNTVRLVATGSTTKEGIGGDAAAQGEVLVSGTLETAGGEYSDSAYGNQSGLPDASGSWGDVALTATGQAASDYGNPLKIQTAAANGTLTRNAGELMLDQGTFVSKTPSEIMSDAGGTLQSDVNLASADKLGQVAYARAFATANVELLNGANVDAGGDVLLLSKTSASAKTDAVSEQASSTLRIMVSAMYGSVYSKAHALIDSGATVSGEEVTVEADTENELEVSAENIANQSTLNSTVAWSQVAVDADAEVNGAVTAHALEIGAHNVNDFATEAVAATGEDSTAGIGVAGAISRQTVQAKAHLGASPTIEGDDEGDITIAAETDTEANKVSAETRQVEHKDKKKAVETGAANLTSSMSTVTGKADGKANGVGKALPFKVGSAVAWTKSSNTATATIAPNVTITTPGNVAVLAVVSDEGIHNAAKSEVASREDEGGGSKVNVSAAVSYADYTHDANANIGSAAQITARNIGLASQVRVPFDWTFGQGDDVATLKNMGSSLEDFQKGIDALHALLPIKSGLPKTIMEGTTGFAGAFGDGSKVGVGASVNYFGMTNTSRAWVGDGSTLTSKNSAGAWTSSLGWLTAATEDNGLTVTTTPATQGDDTATPPQLPVPDSSTITWDHSISILASTEVATFDLVGDLTPWSPSYTGASGAIGGAFNYGGYANTTIAGAGANVTLTSETVDKSAISYGAANAIAVNATSSDTLFALSPISGKGGSVAISGMVALTDVADHTHATLSGSDTVNADKLDINATNPLMVWSLTGALALSSKAGIGLAVGINDVSTDTRALIGDNSADEPGSAGTPSESGGSMAVGSLGIKAITSGEAGALSVAGSVVSGSSGGKNDGSGDKAPEKEPKLLAMLEKITSTADKVREGIGSFQTTLGEVEDLQGDGGAVSQDASAVDNGTKTLLGKASSALELVSEGGAALGKAYKTLSSVGKSESAGKASSGKASFGIGISGAASVNMAALGTRSGVAGVSVDNHGDQADEVTVQALNDANLTSVAGGAALKLGGKGSGGTLAGAVAFSKVGDTTKATIGGPAAGDGATVKANKITVQALDNSQQIDAGVGVAAKIGGSGSSFSVAGSVSIAQSQNQTDADIIGSTLTGGGNAGNDVQLTAYDASGIGIGAGSLNLNVGSGNSVNGSLSLTYADIDNDINAAILAGASGAATAISGFDGFSMHALDGSEIVAAAATGSVSTSTKSNSLTGAIVVNKVGDDAEAKISGGSSVNVSGDIEVVAAAVAPDSTTLAALDLPTAFGKPASSYYDFSGGELEPVVDAADAAGAEADDKATKDAGGEKPGSGTGTGASSGSPGSSIIAVAGNLAVSGNNVGVSFTYNQVTNSHKVSIDDASLDSSAGDISLQANDDTRILSLAAGLGVATGKFAGMGSMIYNDIGNTDAVTLGSTADTAGETTLSAQNLAVSATDRSAIYGLAGAVAISAGTAAVGAAVAYNDIGNTVQTTADNVGITTTATSASEGVAFTASNEARIMAAAVSAGVTPGKAALGVSFGWNQIHDTTTARVTGGSVVDDQMDSGSYGGSLKVTATDSSTIQALTGAAAVSGNVAAAAAISVQEIGDTTQAQLSDAAVQLGDVAVDANSTALEQSIALGIGVGGKGGVSGSIAYNCIGDTLSAGSCTSEGPGATPGTLATVTGITGNDGSSPATISDTLGVSATDGSTIQTLAVGVGGGSAVGIGLSVALSGIGTTTSAIIGTAAPDSGTDTTLTQLDVGNFTTVIAASNASIESLAVGAAVSGSASIAGSSSTNLIHNTVHAGMINVSTGTTSDPSLFDSHNVTTIRATNSAQIASLAGAVAGGDVALGAAVAVNVIGTTTTATFDGSGGSSANPAAWYQVGSLVVQAGATNPGTMSNLPGDLNTTGSGQANIQTIAVSGGAGESVSAFGSVAVNQITGNTQASIGNQAGVVANDNVAVLAGNSQGINVFSGTLSLSGEVALGAGVVVNVLSGETTASIDHSNVSAYANGSALSVADGTPTHLADINSALDVTNPNGDIFKAFKSDVTSVGSTGTPSAPDLGSDSEEIHGVAVNASNQQHAVTLSVGVGVSGAVAGTAEVGVNIIGGTTGASIVASQINQEAPDQQGNQQVSRGQQVNVGAYNAQYAANYLIAAAGSGGVAVSAAVPVNTFNGKTKAYITDSAVSSRASSKGTQVVADSYQWSVNNLGSAAISGSGALSLTGAVSLFTAQTDAYVSGGTINANSFDVLANSAIQSAQIGGALAVAIDPEGSVAGSGMALVNIDNAETSALVENGAVVTDTGEATVKATSSNRSEGIAAQLAAAIEAGLAGTVAVNVLGNTTTAAIDASTMTVDGDLNVKANDTQEVDDIIGGAGIGAVGFAGGVNVTLMQTQVRATIEGGSSVTGKGDVNVDATSTRGVNNATGSGAAGIAGIGVSVGVLIAGTGSGLSSNNNTSMLFDNSGSGGSRSVNLNDIAQMGGTGTLDDSTTYGDINNDTGGIDQINAQTNYGSSWSAATDKTASDGIYAGITGGSSVSTTGDVKLDAQVSEGTSNTAGVGAGGVAAIGASVAYTSLNSDVGASVDSTSSITAAHNVSITAGVKNGNGPQGNALDAAKTAVSTGSSAGNVTVGALGVSVAVADSEIANTVTAENNGSITATAQGNGLPRGTLTVQATDSSTAAAGNSNPSVTVGIGIAAGTMVDTATRSSTITASLGAGSTTDNFDQVNVQAYDKGGASAEGVAGTGGIISGSGTVITAKDTSHVAARIGVPSANGVTTTTLDNNNAVTVLADAEPTLSAKADSTTIGGVAVGVNEVKAIAELNVEALVGTPTTQTGNGSTVVFTPPTLGSITRVMQLKVTGDFAPKVTANGTGNTGGAVAATATEVTTSSSGSNTAEIGNGVTLPTGGTITINANSTPYESANANGVLAGALIGGAFDSTASSNQTTTALLGDAPSGNGSVMLGSLSISATGNDTNDAKTTSGSGALIGGLASTANTTSLSSASASIGSGWDLVLLGGFNLKSNQAFHYGGTADSHFGAAIGGSGAYVNTLMGNGAGYTSAARIGANTSIVSTYDLDVEAQTTFANDANNGGATSGAGGIVTGTAAKTDTVFFANNLVHVGQNDSLQALGMDAAGVMSDVQILADTTAGLVDLAGISIDGAVPIANAATDINGYSTNTINIDKGSTVHSFGKVDIATYSAMGNVAGRATGTSNGVAGVAVSDSDVELTSNQTINLGADPGAGETVPTSGDVDVHISGYAATYVLAGRDILGGTPTQIGPSAIAQAYVHGLIAIPHAGGTAKATSTSSLNMGHGATATSKGDVAIGSTPGLFATSATGAGHGYELGFIPVTQHDNNMSSSGKAYTTINGTVRAGTPGDLDITIDSSGNLTSNSLNYAVNGVAKNNGAGSATPSGVPFAAKQFTNFHPDIYGDDVNGTVTAWVIGTTIYAEPKTPTKGLPQYGSPLYAQGGNVLLFGGVGNSGTNAGYIGGSGSVTANGAPSVNITNNSSDFLIIPGVTEAFGITGFVHLNGSATSGDLNGLSISQTPTTAQPDITIDNAYTGTATPPPDLILTNTVTNYGGSVNLLNQTGSIITETINANSVYIHAPNGNVIFKATPGHLNWTNGHDPASAADLAGSWFLTRLAADFKSNGHWDANRVAAAVVQAHFVPWTSSYDSLNSALANYYNDAFAGPKIYDNGTSTGKAEKTPIIAMSGCEPELHGGPGDGCGGSIQLLPGGSDSYMPAIPWVALSWSGSTPPPMVTKQGSTPISSSQTLTVDACDKDGACGYINIDAPYVVGHAGAWTLQTEQGMKDFIKAYNSQSAVPLYSHLWGSAYVPTEVAARSSSNGVKLTSGAGQTLYYWNGSSYEPLLGKQLANSQLIGATYDPSRGSIVLDNVYANGGGSATLIGHVVSTGNGKLTVNNGYGQVLVNNTSGVPLDVNNINTGKAQTGLITFVDYSKLHNGNPTKTWYISVGGDAPLVFTDNSDLASAGSGFTWANGGNEVTLTTDEAKVMGVSEAYQLKPSTAGQLNYNPASDQYYNWGVYARVKRTVNFSSSPSSTPWSFIDSSGKGTTNDKAWSIIKGSFSSQATVSLNGNAWAANMSASGTHTWYIFPFKYHGCGGDIGDGCHYGTHQTGWQASKDSDGNWQTEPVSAWSFLYPDRGTLTVNVTQSASMPIGISFNTTETNRVEVDSNADINLYGIIDNTNQPQQTNKPDTLLHASDGGNIVQANEQALIWTHDLAMITAGGGSIGSAYRPIQVRIANKSGADKTATLLASTDGNIKGFPPFWAYYFGNDGSINIDVNSGTAALPIKAIAQGKANGHVVHGKVNIHATGSLISTDAAGVTVNGLAYLRALSDPWAAVAGGNFGPNENEDIVGNAVNLVSETGSIGTATAPLRVQTYQPMPGQGGWLTVNAASDVNISDDAGDILVDQVVSQLGNVTLKALNGGIYDAHAVSAAATLTSTQLKSIWAQDGLLDGSSAVKAVTGQVNAAYDEYAGMLGMGTVDAATGAFSFTLTGSALQDKLNAYWQLAAVHEGLDPSAKPTDEATLQSDVESYLSYRAGNDITLFNKWIGADWDTQDEFKAAALTGPVKNAYVEYEQLLGMGTVDATTGAFSFTLTGSALQDKLNAYWSVAAIAKGVSTRPSDPATLQQDVEDYLSAQAGNDIDLFEERFGTNWSTQTVFTSPVAFGYKFALTTQQQSDLGNSKAWKINQLLYSLNAAALEAPATNGGNHSTTLTPTTVGTNFKPNVSGQNVTLIANKGGFGQLGVPLVIQEADLKTLYRTGTLGGSLDEAALNAMAAASTPGDITVYDTNGNQIAPQTLASLGAFDCIGTGTGCVQATVGTTTIDEIHIKQTDPLFLSVGKVLHGNASGAVYLQAKGDLHINQLTSGQDMSVAATGNILAPAGSTYSASQPVLTVGGDLVIAANGAVEFGDGSGDNLGDPLPVSIKGTLRKGSAATDLLLRQVVSAGDLDVNEAVANGMVQLQAPGGNLYAVTNRTTVSGKDMSFEAKGNIGYWNSGTLAALLVQQTGTGGVLDANALNGAINMAAPSDDLHAGTVSSHGNLELTVQLGSLTADQLTSLAGAIFATAHDDASIDWAQGFTGVTLDAVTGLLTTGDKIINAGAGDVALTGDTGILVKGVVSAHNGNIAGTVTNTSGSAHFEMQSGASIASNTGNVTIIAAGADDSLLMDFGTSTSSSINAAGDITINVGDNAVLGMLQSTASTGTAIAVTAGGAIRGNGTAVNLTERAGGSSKLQSNDDIGSASRYLVVDVDTLTADSSQGSIYLRGLGNLSVPTLSAHDDLHLNVDQALEYGAMDVGNVATINAGSVDGTSLITRSDANIHATGDMTLGTVGAGGNLVADSGANLDATTLTSGGDATLTSTTAMDLGSVTSGGALAATAGTDLTAATLDSGKTATLTAKTGSLKITDTLTSAGDATLRSGADTDIHALHVGGDVTGTAGGNLAVTQGAVAGTGTLTAHDALTLGTWTEGGDLTTQSGTQTALGTVVLTAGNLHSTAGGDLTAQDVDIQHGSATFESAANMSLAKVTTATALDAKSGGTLNGATLTAGTDANLASVGDMTLGSVDAGGKLVADSGANLDATTLTSGADATLTSTKAMDLGSVTSGGALAATAGTDLTAATLDSGKSATLTAKTGTLKITDTLTSAGDATLQSGADTDIHALHVGGDVIGTAGGNLAVTQGTVAGTGTLTAHDALTLGTWTEDGDLTTQSGTQTAFGTVVLTAGNLHSTAGGDLTAQDVDIQHGSAMFDTGASLTAAKLVAADDITIQAADAVSTQRVIAGHDITVHAGGDISMDASTAGHDILMDSSGGAIAIADYAKAGDAISLAGQQITFNDVEAPNTVQLWARDGDILANTLRTRDAYAQANGDIVLDAGYIGNRINLEAHNITAHVKQTSTGQPLYSVLSGYQGGVADRITVDADVSERWIIDRLAAVVAALRTTAPNADIVSGRIMHTMSLDTSKARVRMNQQDPTLVPADVQLMQPTHDFALYQDGIHSLTNAFVVRFGYGYQIQTPNYIKTHMSLNPDYLGESALRNNGRFLNMDDYLLNDDKPRRKHVIPSWIRTNKNDLVKPATDVPAVNLHAPH